MALIRCCECRKEVSDKAATCPHCGAPVIVPAAAARSGGALRALKWIGGLFLFFILVRACGQLGTPVTTAPSTPPSVATPPATSEPPSQATLKLWSADLIDEAAPAARRASAASNILQNFPDAAVAAKAKELLPNLTSMGEDEKTNGAWSYANEEDGMSGKQIAQAQVRSENLLSLRFPYQGKQIGTLIVRRHPKWGKEVIVSIEKGQILCSSYDCPVRLRFDDAQPVTYSGNEPADQSTETVFLPYSIAKKLETTKRLKVEFNVYHNGIQVLEFNVKGFNQKKMDVSTAGASQ